MVVENNTIINVLLFLCDSIVRFGRALSVIKCIREPLRCRPHTIRIACILIYTHGSIIIIKTIVINIIKTQ